MESPGVVLLMGMTGAGKSTFVSHLKTLENQVQIGHGLESKTADLAVYEACAPKTPNQRVLLADTPGFNDTVRSDTDVLQSIITPLYELQKKNHPIHGIIYLHNITNPRLAGTALRMLKMLQQFCGKVNYNRIVFATTMWEDANFTPHGGRAANQRHKELEREFWNDMFAGNGGVVRHLRDDQDSAGDVLDHFFNEFNKLRKSDRERSLQVFDEMINGKLVEQTSAYRCVHEEQRLLRQQKEQQLAGLVEQRRRLQLESQAETCREDIAYGYSYEVSHEVRHSSGDKQPRRDSPVSKHKQYLPWWLQQIITSKAENQARPTRTRAQDKITRQRK
ncbi:P-loop containing nucleoside triphosphate hydrolase protein [Lasiosphaeris hirsuta]|uniref:P-loop containing nucleoside triphosphate hydrolase protein n=1 Tax=Lasiosphaeris hirsuta TaxID=260670 RepID=A0AA40E5T7_9PEZI|nr:P-loop containing nucleoside triphosphate hydrolase protein [Lasiosphaeris hirsuta]